MQIINRIEMRFGLKMSDNQLIENKIGGGVKMPLCHIRHKQKEFLV